MQTEPGSIPGSGEALAKFSRIYAELYCDFNEAIPRPLGGQEVPQNENFEKTNLKKKKLPQDLVSYLVTMVHYSFFSYFFIYSLYSCQGSF